MMEEELVSETQVSDSTLTRQIAREDFVIFMESESFKFYMSVRHPASTFQTQAAGHVKQLEHTSCTRKGTRRPRHAEAKVKHV
jgi:hypothetical protein